jgi:hypothetical protein
MYMRSPASMQLHRSVLPSMSPSVISPADRSRAKVSGPFSARKKVALTLEQPHARHPR